MCTVLYTVRIYSYFVHNSLDEVRDAYKDFGVIGRVGEPLEVAKAIAYLASDDAGFVTGETLTIDGGFLLK